MSRTMMGKRDKKTLLKIDMKVARIRKRIGDNVQRERRKKRMALQKLAEKAKLNPEELNLIEMGYGEIELYHIVCLAHLLKKEPEDLMKELC